ncbi:MAG: LysR family transcriptional regulator [Pseudomonadota bacterium]
MKFIMESWDEFRTAFEVANTGTVSGAAERLGMHRSTVTRHIDALESRLGTRVFHRHAKGYTPTDLGRELMAAGRRADEAIAQFIGRSQLHSTQVDGDLVVAAPVAFTPFLVLAAKRFQQRHPTTRVRLTCAAQQPRLEYGEAHILFHVGEQPQLPDNVVQPLLKLESAVYAHRSYIRQFGKPSRLEEFDGHRFVLIDDNLLSKSSAWLRKRVNAADVVFESDSPTTAFRAVMEGLGIGCLPTLLARDEPSLERVLAPQIPEFRMTCWTVTHGDIHRTPKLQSFIQCMRELQPVSWAACDVELPRLIAL